MYNIAILFLHVIVIASLSLVALRLGKEALIAWLSLLGVTMNLFVLKPITLFRLHVTASEALAVGYLLSLNLLRAYFDIEAAKKGVLISFLMLIAFFLLSQCHLLYQSVDEHYAPLLRLMPRLLFASLATFLVVQLFDLTLFSRLHLSLVARTGITMVFSETLDTLLFSFLGLWGVVESVGEIILFVLSIKFIVIVCNLPFVALSRRIIGTQV
ncbi:MAG: queuosine precursor transporter [Chlamydiales bacterium]